MIAQTVMSVGLFQVILGHRHGVMKQLDQHVCRELLHQLDVFFVHNLTFSSGTGYRDRTDDFRVET